MNLQGKVALVTGASRGSARPLPLSWVVRAQS